MDEMKKGSEGNIASRDHAHTAGFALEKVALPGVTPHDPNERWGQKHIRLTFRLWEHEAQFDTEVGGNCLGLSNLSSAIYQVLDKLPEGDFGAPYRLTLTNAAGDELICDDEEGQEEDWLMEMLVCAELVAVTAKHARGSAEGVAAGSERSEAPGGNIDPS